MPKYEQTYFILHTKRVQDLFSISSCRPLDSPLAPSDCRLFAKSLFLSLFLFSCPFLSFLSLYLSLSFTLFLSFSTFLYLSIFLSSTLLLFLTADERQINEQETSTLVFNIYYTIYLSIIFLALISTFNSFSHLLQSFCSWRIQVGLSKINES